MASLERRSPAAHNAQQADARIYFTSQKSWEREEGLGQEIERCRAMVQAGKAERMYLATPDGRRSF